MLTQSQLDWIRTFAKILVAVLLYLAKSPLKWAKKTDATTPVFASPIQPQLSTDKKEGPAMNITSILKALTLAPVVVAGIEQLHAEASGSTKKQLAQDSLTLASGIAAAVDSSDTATINAVSQSVGTMIDSVVSIMNATGVFAHKTSDQTANLTPQTVAN